MKRLSVAVQVYSVREDAEKDFLGTLKQIKEIGYDAVELAGLYGLTAAEVKAALDEVGLAAVSAHVPFKLLVDDMEKTIDDYVTIGVKYIAIPYLENEDRPDAGNFDSTLDKIKKICAACKAKGITTLYHNHDFEFFTMPNGQYALDYMYDSIPADLLQTEIDCCWVKVSGINPADYIKKYSGRAPVVHLKDFYMEGRPANLYKLIGTDVEEKEETGGTFEFRPVGSGLQDFPSIIEAAKEAGSEVVVVEQDQSIGRTPMEAIRMSREYLKTLGL